MFIITHRPENLRNQEPYDSFSLGVEGEATRLRLNVSDRHGIRGSTAPKGRSSVYKDFQLLNPCPSTSVASQMERKAFGSFSLRNALS